jgi:Ribosome-assembly protein 3
MTTADSSSSSMNNLDNLNLPCNEQALAVDAAVQKALDLVQRYSENDTDPAWQNPDLIYQQLDQARAEISLAWKNLDAATAALSPDTATAAAAAGCSTKEQLRTAYMDMITDAFADVLENMRQNSQVNNDPIDVEVLVDLLQSGLDLFYMNHSIQLMGEADFLWNSSYDNDDTDAMNDDDEEVLLTPHELRRRELGFHVEESTA